MKQFLLLLSFLAVTTLANGQREYCYNCSNAPSDYNKSFGNAPSNDLVMYPNPVTDYFGISDNENVKQIAVINLLGRRVKTFEYNRGERYNISDLPQGVYLVQFIGKNSRVMSTQRMSKR